MSTTNNRGRKRQAPTESSNQSETNENLSADDGMSVPGTATYDENLSQISGGKRRRKKFTPTQRAHVAKVRKAGACPECRARKVKCPHALLQGTDGPPDSIPAPKPSPQYYHFDVEAKYLDLAFTGKKYPGTIVEDDPEQCRQSDVVQFPNPSFDYGSHLINTVPALKSRQETMADVLYDFGNVFEDDAGRSTVKTAPNSQKWGRGSPWMMAATASSQPSTTYTPSNTNLSIDLGPPPSTPPSSHTDLLSPYTQDIVYCRCDEYGCARQHKVTQDVHLRHNQELEHADVQSSILSYHCPVNCGAKAFRNLDYLQNHITSNHLEILPSPTQLPQSNVSERGVQPDRSAHLQESLDCQYVPGMGDNSIAITDQVISEEIDSLAGRNWRRAYSPKEAPYRRVLRDHSMRRSHSPLQGQPSTIPTGDSTHKPSRQFSIGSSNHGIGSTATNSNASFRGSAFRSQHIMEGMNDHRMPQGYPQRTNSPTPSFINQFRQTQISEQSHLEVYSEIVEELTGPPIPRDRHAMFVPSNAGLLTPPAAFTPEDKSMMAFNEQTFNGYINLEHARLGNNFQSGHNGPDLGVPAWPGLGSSMPTTQTGVFNGGYGPPGFQTDVPVTQYPPSDGSLLDFSVPPSNTEQPMLMLNDEPMQNPDFFDPDDLALEQAMSHPNTLPYLEHGTSTMSSSGASDSVLGLADAQAQNPFAEKYEDWDMYGLNIQNPE